ncbi:MAG: hypothetical protein RL582_130 [Bacteroidota bacterium]
MISFGTATSMAQNVIFTRQDSLRGNTEGARMEWNVKKYELEIKPNLEKHILSGKQKITFDCNKINTLQIDLQEPMIIDHVVLQQKSVSFYREGNVYWVNLGKKRKRKNSVLTIRFHGKPKEAVNPPWDGGWIWSKDQNGKPFVSVACQGLGASSWFPCKDSQADEPELGSTLSIEIPDSLVAVSNGKLVKKETLSNSRNITQKWEVKNPINPYNIIPYIGDYVYSSDTFYGIDGTLKLNYFVLNGHQEKAKNQFTDVKKMLKAFEYWFGPYPFYEDEYKLVEAPHLGMEHQSAIAYGNKFKKGYLGTDLSGTGHGLDWDFIIIHESGHEWFGNNITSKDIADMWIHESFTTYSEALFIEYYKGKKIAEAYVVGLRKKIENDIPIIGTYGVNREGSGDMYNKGGNMIHTIRTIINDDDRFRKMLLEMNLKFKHKTVTTQEIENFMIDFSGKNLKPIFDQYLRTIKIPELQIKRKNGNSFTYKWNNVVSRFDMPVKIFINGKNEFWIHPSADEQTFDFTSGIIEDMKADDGFYISMKSIAN